MNVTDQYLDGDDHVNLFQREVSTETTQNFIHEKIKKELIAGNAFTM
jgi:hypothetical protein